jgi:hypothetical protein
LKPIAIFLRVIRWRMPDGLRYRPSRLLRDIHGFLWFGLTDLALLAHLAPCMTRAKSATL